MFYVLRLIFGSWKTFLATSFITTFIFLFWKSILNFVVYMLNKVISMIEIEAGLDPIIVTYTGVAAYFIQRFKIVECFAVIITCVLLRVTLKIIPFSPFK